VYAEFLYIKYNSRFHYAHQLSFLIISPIQTKNNKKLPLQIKQGGVVVYFSISFIISS
jgi:hypothetical protein